MIYCVSHQSSGLILFQQQQISNKTLGDSHPVPDSHCMYNRYPEPLVGRSRSRHRRRKAVPSVGGRVRTAGSQSLPPVESAPGAKKSQAPRKRAQSAVSGKKKTKNT